MTILEVLKRVKPNVDFVHSGNFVDDMIFDSFEFIELVEELESTYEIEISGKDIVPENFASIKSIENLVKKSGGKIE